MKLLKKIFIINLAVILLMLSFTSCDKPLEIPENTDGPGTGAANITDTSDSNDDAGTDESATGANNGNGNGIYKDGFVFIYNGTTVYLGGYIKSVLAEIGAPTDYYESDSCTSDGMMQTYCYGGLEIYTYAKTDTDEYRIFSVALMDDVNSTAEGIYIGQTVGDMTALYGAEYESIPGFYYKYTKNGTALTFDVDEDIIIAITYMLLNV